MGIGHKDRRAPQSEATRMNEADIRTVQLLLGVASAVFEAPAFVMKGGTALKLFAQDMSRLSVDLDVVFVRHELVRDEVMK